jgi:propanol-preferring alcohol dehydrogenase
MRATRLDAPKMPLVTVDVPRPVPAAGELLLRVRACGVCRTDLHIVDGELPAHRSPVIPGHQIVGEVAGGATDTRPQGMRVGVSWMASVDGTCPFCLRGEENLCDRPLFTGYDADGGYAEYALARADFTYPLPQALDDVHAAPLLCAGVIGFRALRVAGVLRGDRVGLYGFGASAHLMVPVLRAWECEVYVATRGARHRELADSLGVDWVGEATERPPVSLDRAITFAPAGDVVVAALGALRKGGVVAINAIHLDRIPEFDYDSLLWGERQVRSVANMTRADARDFLALAAQIDLRPHANVFSLENANEALASLRRDEVSGAAVIVP